MDTEKLKEIIAGRKQELFDLLSELIRIDTQNFGEHGNESNLAKLLADKITELGYVPDVFSPDDMPEVTASEDYYAGHHLANRPCVCTLVPGSSHEKRVMLAAHIDTVPVGDKENWSDDPFSGKQCDGRICGRGSGDDKCGIALSLFLMKIFRENEIVLPYDLVFAAYCDEEFGGGNGALACSLRYPSDELINLDGDDFQIWTAATGGGCFTAHIKCPDTLDNAKLMLTGLNILSAELDEFAKRRYDEISADPVYAGTGIAETAVRYNEIRAGFNDQDKNRAHIMVTYYTTLSKGRILKELQKMGESLQKKLAPFGLEFDRFDLTTRFFHCLKTSADSKAIEAIISAGKEISGRDIRTVGSCLSDQSLFLKYGSAHAISWGCGRDFSLPGGAHQPDEYIEMGAYTELAQILAVALVRMFN